MKTKTKKVKVEPYLASIKIYGKVYKAEGETLKEAIANLKPEIGKGTSILTISHKGKSKDRFFPSAQTQRLFSLSPLMKEVALKNISLLFDL